MAQAPTMRGALCPLLPGQPCTLCHPDAHLGPQDCPTVAIVMDDPQLRAELAGKREAYRQARAHPASARIRHSESAQRGARDGEQPSAPGGRN
ncbi:MAG: DUF6767 domain-containing protein [Candidatus Nanopelagicales bacterium]